MGGRGYADDFQNLSQILVQAIQHKGFAVVDILQPCVTFNLVNTREWYAKHMKKLSDMNWDPTNKDKALLITANWEEGIPIGVIYREERPTFEDQQPALKNGPLVDQVRSYSVSALLSDFQ